MAWLLDTNVLSELRRLRPDPKVSAFVASAPLDQLYVSSVTLAELRFGIELLSEGSNRRDELNSWFEQRVLPVTEEIMFRWRILVDEGRKAGHTFSQPDLIIAATAIYHGLTVVTRDRSGFDKAGVSVVNPFDA
jgi:predicted nucleic acid-binding protein